MTHRELQVLQYLRGGGWIAAGTVPAGSKLIRSLIDKGWIEQRQDEAGTAFRITAAGLEAKMTPTR